MRMRGQVLKYHFLVLLLVLLSKPQGVAPFSGENPLLFKMTQECEKGQTVVSDGECMNETYLEKWHHFSLTYKAARSRGFSEKAAFSVAWHADMIDSYGYNPLVWAKSWDRAQAHLAVQEDYIKNMHFDDLSSTAAVECAWQRYLYRTFAGLLWAKEKNNLAAAQVVLGVSFHALEDFYSHSIWLNAEKRRGLTWFQTTAEERNNWTLWTGAYEEPVEHGLKHHGKFDFACAYLNTLPSSVMENLVCHAASPLSGKEDSVCEHWKECQDGKSVSTTVAGISVPTGVVFTLPGINLDATWLADAGVEERGLSGVTGEEMFETAYERAYETAQQWLDTLELWMEQAGAGDFWNKLKSSSSSEDARHSQWNDFDKFPFLFAAFGSYPPQKSTCGDENKYYLRVRLKTGSDAGAGTDADIYLKAGGKKYLLDYIPGTVSFYNDFEKEDNAVYWVGPLSSLPDKITILNDATTVGESFESLWNAFVDFLEDFWKTLKSIALSIIGGNDDYVAKNHSYWKIENLKEGEEKEISFNLDGDSEGHYKATGKIKKTKTESGEYKVKVELNTLKCEKESEWDRGSNSDEPYVLAVMASLPGEIKGDITDPKDDVDAGENRDISIDLTSDALPSNGMVSVTVVLMENDDEGEKGREEYLDELMGKLDEETEDVRVKFASMLVTEWTLSEIEVFGYSNGVTSFEAGTVLQDTKNREIGANEDVTFNLSKLKSYDMPRLPGFAPPDYAPLKMVAVTEEKDNKVKLLVTYDPKDWGKTVVVGVYPVNSKGERVTSSFKISPEKFDSEDGEANVSINYTGTSNVKTYGFQAVIYEQGMESDPLLSYTYDYEHTWSD